MSRRVKAPVVTGPVVTGPVVMGLHHEPATVHAMDSDAMDSDAMVRVMVRVAPGPRPKVSVAMAHRSPVATARGKDLAPRGIARDHPVATARRRRFVGTVRPAAMVRRALDGKALRPEETGQAEGAPRRTAHVVTRCTSKRSVRGGRR